MSFLLYRKKFRSANEVYMHACAVHCPDSIDSSAEIYCQWGPGPNLCDNLPRKRFSLMTHMNDRHCTLESFKAVVARRLASPTPATNQPAHPITIIKNPVAPQAQTQDNSVAGTASPALSTSSSGSFNANSNSAAVQAIKRHSLDIVNQKELLVSSVFSNISELICVTRSNDLKQFKQDLKFIILFHIHSLRMKTRDQSQKVYV